MKKTKIIIKTKGILENSEKFKSDYEETLNKELNNGYTIKASNFTCNGNFAYIYTLLEKEVD